LGIHILDVNFTSTRFQSSLVGEASKNITKEAQMSKNWPFWLTTFVMDEMDSLAMDRKSVNELKLTLQRKIFLNIPLMQSIHFYHSSVMSLKKDQI
jgi:ectoine hydroxylase-related dioxygenase (phytanoyl-CoA dioxygenase family)